MRGRSSRSRAERLAWQRLGDAYAALEQAEVELAAALEAVVLQGSGDGRAPDRAVIPIRRDRRLWASEVRA